MTGSYLFRPARYLTLDGKRYYAASALHLVEQMRLDAFFTDARNISEYMIEVSKRTWQYSGHNVRTATAFVFVADLVAAGQLRVLSKAEN